MIRKSSGKREEATAAATVEFACVLVVLVQASKLRGSSTARLPLTTMYNTNTPEYVTKPGPTTQQTLNPANDLTQAPGFLLSADVCLVVVEAGQLSLTAVQLKAW